MSAWYNYELSYLKKSLYLKSISLLPRDKLIKPMTKSFNILDKVNLCKTGINKIERLNGKYGVRAIF